MSVKEWLSNAQRYILRFRYGLTEYNQGSSVFTTFYGQRLSSVDSSGLKELDLSNYETALAFIRRKEERKATTSTQRQLVGNDAHSGGLLHPDSVGIGEYTSWYKHYDDDGLTELPSNYCFANQYHSYTGRRTLIYLPCAVPACRSLVRIDYEDPTYKDGAMASNYIASSLPVPTWLTEDTKFTCEDSIAFFEVARPRSCPLLTSSPALTELQSIGIRPTTFIQEPLKMSRAAFMNEPATTYVVLRDEANHRYGYFRAPVYGDVLGARTPVRFENSAITQPPNLDDVTELQKSICWAPLRQIVELAQHIPLLEDITLLDDSLE